MYELQNIPTLPKVRITKEEERKPLSAANNANTTPSVANSASNDNGNPDHAMCQRNSPTGLSLSIGARFLDAARLYNAFV